MLIKDCWVGQWLVPTGRHYIPYICRIVSINRVNHYLDIFWPSDQNTSFLREEDLNLDYSTLKDGMVVYCKTGLSSFANGKPGYYLWHPKESEFISTDMPSYLSQEEMKRVAKLKAFW